MSRYKGHVIATTACIGGELGSEIMLAEEAEAVKDYNTAQLHLGKIHELITFCQSVFGEDFYLEVAPSTKEDQIAVNRRIKRIGEAFNVKLVVGTDSHYLTTAERQVHKAYLNSKNGEREVDDFYEFSRLMNSEEVFELLNLAYDDDNFIHQILDNTIEIQNKITFYSLEHKQMIPKVELPNYSEWDIYEYTKKYDWQFSAGTWPTLKWLCEEGNIQERYWLYECLKSLHDKNLQDKTEYWDRLEIEADIIEYIGEKLDDCLFAYFNTFKHYIDLFWECGSIVGPGRGSSTGFLSNYLLGITQLDPIRWDIKHWRFLNKERAELPSLLMILGSCKKRTLTIA
jgi:DNA polymerase-3 subunit alpha